MLSNRLYSADDAETNATLSSGSVLESSTYYVRDAQGNVMGVYEHKMDAENAVMEYKLIERNMYGSAQVGICKDTVDLNITNAAGALTQATYYHARQLNHRQYSLSNHLGNVLTTIGDGKAPVDSNSDGVIDYYVAYIISVSDYSPFGVELASRSWGIEEYRSGFQKQESDKELWEGAMYYKYRVEDPRLGRFFSVDQLYAKYPYNSNYAFSENRVIDAIELEGCENLKVAINNEPTSEKSGSAKITITLDYQVVTSGRGALSILINPTDFHNTFSLGNGTFYMTSIPTSTNEGRFLIGKHEKWAQMAEQGSVKHQQKLKNAGILYYKLEVEYNYSTTDVNSVEDAQKWMNEDPQGRGIIIAPLEYQVSDDNRLAQSNEDAKKRFLDSSVGGLGQNETYAHWDYNLINLNPKTNIKMSPTDLAVHEAGHNSAASHFHTKLGNGNYEYDQIGLQSNQSGCIYPNRTNTRTIIKDKTNRKTIN